jgi:hypothetical protein
MEVRNEVAAKGGEFHHIQQQIDYETATDEQSGNLKEIGGVPTSMNTEEEVDFRPTKVAVDKGNTVTSYVYTFMQLAAGQKWHCYLAPTAHQLSR